MQRGFQKATLSAGSSGGWNAAGGVGGPALVFIAAGAGTALGHLAPAKNSSAQELRSRLKSFYCQCNIRP